MKIGHIFFISGLANLILSLVVFYAFNKMQNQCFELIGKYKKLTEDRENRILYLETQDFLLQNKYPKESLDIYIEATAIMQEQIKAKARLKN